MIESRGTVGVQAEREKLVYESDWLASRPFFYNLHTGHAGHNINDVIDFADLEFDPEGLNDYLDFGHCVFEHTPVKDVRLLRFSTRLWSGSGGLRVEHLADPTHEWWETSSTVDEVVEAAADVVSEAAQAAEGDVVVPTSGGLDSRFIHLLLSDRSRVRAFTYGVSDQPEHSQEVVKAAELARRLGLRWETVRLGEFHRYLDDWDALFGPSVHAHGMYQMEFYRKLAPRVAPDSLVISGAFGDSLAGYDDHTVAEIATLDRPDDLLSVLRFGHMCADSGASVFTSRREGWQRQLADEPLLRCELRPRVVALNRQQMPLFSYLYSVPQALGLKPRAPFTDARLAKLMLTLPWEARAERRWQRELFGRHGLDLESARLSYDWRNTLNLRAMRRIPLQPLDVKLLREVVKPEYVRWINRTVGPLGLPWEAFMRLGWTPGFRRTTSALRAAGLTDQRLPAYYAYLTLRPLQSLLRRRDEARSGKTGATR